MKYRKLDEFGDYILGGREHILSGHDAVAQAIRTRLLLLLGEWWEDEEDGLPLFEQVFGAFRGGEAAEDVDLLLSERILATEGVLEILEFESSFDPARRVYTASCQVGTAFGAVNVEIGGDQLVAAL